ncbi:response regulator [Bradyrhizobium canariense]|uniref:response regulator n=1 Tax=Bradyrhizobium canariense TaxID=255045 RepID=UPI001177E168|nr:response regulator [Bradyrhizobium canariense]
MFEAAPVRILVVEDDELIREFVVEALREEGFEVVEAENGEQGEQRRALCEEGERTILELRRSIFESASGTCRDQGENRKD